jgi:hypothetical protein
MTWLSIETQSTFEAFPPDSVARQTLIIALCFTAFSYFRQNGSFPGVLRSSSPSGSLRIPTQRFFCNTFFPVSQSTIFQLPFSVFNL